MHRVWDSGLACQWVNLPVGQSANLTHPPKPSHAGEACPHPFLSEIDGWTCFQVEIGESPLCP